MTSVIRDTFIKKTNTVKRDRYCKCGNFFSTYEKFVKSTKSRKERPDTLWKNERVIWYAILRYAAASKIERKSSIKIGLDLKKIHKNKKSLIKQFKIISSKTEYIRSWNKNKGKSWFEIKFKKKKIIHKMESKKQTIKNILKDPYYWELRQYFFPNKSCYDLFNKDKVRKEINEFYKSICSYIDQKQYNKDFFMKNLPGTEDFWNKDQNWNTWEIIR